MHTSAITQKRTQVHIFVTEREIVNRTTATYTRPATKQGTDTHITSHNITSH